MRRAGVVVVAAVLSLARGATSQVAGPAGEPALRLIELQADTTSDIDVIVELNDPPLALQRAPMAIFEANFARLRRDVATIEQRVYRTKTAIEPLVRHEYFEVFHGTAMRVPRGALAQIRALPYVKRVHRDTAVQALTETNIEAVGAVRTWNTRGTRGAGVTVAIIDTGIDYTHPALGGAFGSGHKVAGGWDFVNDDGDPKDDAGHGTHVAGIVAANLDTFSGVAPDATLFAYKVLDSHGRGSESNVIAALERALDPNRDGDLSDHAAVANLSLGGDGNPDDAVSLAVDHAVAAGMVVCVAAGNSGAFHAVASPGTARDAITVGAVDNSDALAVFSSKGPSSKLTSIKPDVVAPGVSIRSTYLNGGYATLSGTSMATPHVAGAAALLRAIHPDWTPSEVKSALMLYAKPIAYEQMAQGAGRIDVARSAEGTIVASPASVSFGLDALTTGAFQKAQRIRVTNRGTKSESVTVSPDGLRSGVTMLIIPPKLELAAGASDEVTVSISVAENSAPLTSDSYAFGGMLSLDTATAQTHLPWALVKASRATLLTDMDLIGQFWIGPARVPSAVIIDEGTTETLLPPGDYDLFLAGVEVPLGATAPSAESLVVLDARPVRGDVTLTANRSLASHTITFDGVDANGMRLFRPSTPAASYVPRTRLLMPAGSYLQALDLPSYNLAKIAISDVSSRWSVLAIETLFDREHATFTQVNHAPLKGIAADVELTNAPSELRHAPVKLPSNYEVTIGSVVATKGVSTKVTASAVDFYLNPSDPSFASAFSITAPDLLVPSIAARGDRIEIGSAYSAADGETLVFGVGPLYPRTPVSITNSLLSPPFGFAGQLGESRTRYDSTGFFTVKNSSGTIVATGTPLTNAFYILPAKYTIESVATVSLGDRMARAEVVATINSALGDAAAPGLTSMYVADANGRAVTTLAPHAHGTVRLAANVMAAKVWSRIGSGGWIELPVFFDGDNRRHADLPDLNATAVDLRIELTDLRANRMVYTLAPAFTVGDVPLLPRRRP